MCLNKEFICTYNKLICLLSNSSYQIVKNYTLIKRVGLC